MVVSTACPSRSQSEGIDSEIAKDSGLEPPCRRWRLGGGLGAADLPRTRRAGVGLNGTATRFAPIASGGPDAAGNGAAARLSCEFAAEISSGCYGPRRHIWPKPPVPATPRLCPDDGGNL